MEGIAGLAVAFSSVLGAVPAQECININGSAKTAPLLLNDIALLFTYCCFHAYPVNAYTH